MSGGMVKLDFVIREAIADKGYTTLHKYVPYLGYAIRCLRQMNLDHDNEVKTVKLKVSERRTVKYPDDYIAYNKLGVLIGDRLYNFVRDNTITTWHEDQYTANKPFYKQALNKLSELRYYNYYPSTSSVYGFQSHQDVWGYAHNGVGYFKPNNACREFQFSSEIASEDVILEYISNNFNPDTETMVPITMRDAIREYIHWMDARFKPGTPMGRIQMEEMEYLKELSRYKRRIMDLSFQDILDSLRRTTHLAIKG